MQNLRKYLERYSEWVALALGAIYLLYVIYSNVVTPPITSSAGKKTVTPGQVDQVTLDESAKPLEQAMNRTEVPTYKVEAFAEHFKEVIEGQGPLAMALVDPPMFYPIVGGSIQPEFDRQQQQQQVAPGLATVPKAPEAHPFGIVTGLSTLQLPDPNAKPVVGKDGNNV